MGTVQEANEEEAIQRSVHCHCTLPVGTRMTISIPTMLSIEGIMSKRNSVQRRLRTLAKKLIGRRICCEGLVCPGTVGGTFRVGVLGISAGLAGIRYIYLAKV